jgi:hypothetical protein
VESLLWHIQDKAITFCDLFKFTRLSGSELLLESSTHPTFAYTPPSYALISSLGAAILAAFRRDEKLIERVIFP